MDRRHSHLVSQRRRRRIAALASAIVIVVVAVAAGAGLDLPGSVRGPGAVGVVQLALILGPAIGHAYIAIGRRLTGAAESIVAFAAGGAAEATDSSVTLARTVPAAQAVVTAWVRLGLHLAEIAVRAAIDSLRRAAGVSHIAIAPRMSSHTLGAAA